MELAHLTGGLACALRGAPARVIVLLVDVPDYFDPDDIIKVPAHELQDDDRPFHAIRIGNVTLITKVYWRIVHY